MFKWIRKSERGLLAKGDVIEVWPSDQESTVFPPMLRMESAADPKNVMVSCGGGSICFTDQELELLAQTVFALKPSLRHQLEQEREFIDPMDPNRS